MELRQMGHREESDGMGTVRIGRFVREDIGGVNFRWGGCLRAGGGGLIVAGA